MKKLFPVLLPALPCFTQTVQIKVCVCTALVLLASCTNTQVRWDATKMRQDVMVYYNDQIMDNLIKAKNDLPFVHVDIQSLTSAGASQVSGSIGYGETITNTGTRQLTNQTVTTDTVSAAPSHAVAGTIGVVGTLVHAALRPFTYSVTPLRSETLTITTAPALGAQALASPPPAPESTMAPTKETKATVKGGANDGQITTTTEQTLKAAPQPKPRTIYDLYEEFAKSPSKKCKDCKGYLSDSPIEPKQGTYVPGTLKKWRTENRTEYYFIAKDNQEEYYKLCKKLFTKAQTGSLEQNVQEIRGQFESLKAAPIPP